LQSLIHKNENLETEDKRLEQSFEEFSRSQRSTTEAKAQVEELNLTLEKQIAALEARDQSQLEGITRHELEKSTLREEIERLQTPLDAERTVHKTLEEQYASQRAQELEKLKLDYQTTTNNLEAKQRETLQAMKLQQQQQLEETKSSHDEEITKLRAAHHEELNRITSERESILKAKRSHWWHYCDKLKSNAAHKQSTVQEELKKSKSDTSMLQTHVDSKRRDIHKLTHELGTAADELKAVRDREARRHDTLRNREREASKKSKKQAADLKLLRAKLQQTCEAADTNTKILKADKTRLGREVDVLRDQVKRLNSRPCRTCWRRQRPDT
jgi:hypothetical protein